MTEKSSDSNDWLARQKRAGRSGETEPCSVQLAVAADGGGGNVELSCRKGPTINRATLENFCEIKMFESSISPSGLLERVVLPYSLPQSASMLVFSDIFILGQYCGILFSCGCNDDLIRRVSVEGQR